MSIKKIKEGSKAYNQMAIELALARVSIHPCADCGGPLLVGFACEHCDGDSGAEQNSESSDIHFTAKRTSNL